MPPLGTTAVKPAGDAGTKALERFPSGPPITLYHVDATGGLLAAIEQSGKMVDLRSGEFWFTTNVESRVGFKGGAGLDNIIKFTVDRRFVALLSELALDQRTGSVAEKGLKYFLGVDLAVPRVNFEGGGRGVKLPDGDVNIALRMTNAAPEFNRLFQASIKGMEHLRYNKSAPPGQRLETVKALGPGAPALVAPRGSVPAGPTKAFAAGDAKFRTAEIALRGVNFVIQRINDRIQKRRFDERWAKIGPEVERRLESDPTLGALILVTYSRRSKVGAENDSPLEHVSVFEDIGVGYGYTREDARFAYADSKKGGSYKAPKGDEVAVDDSYWIPPKKPVDVSKLRTPWPAIALGTFRQGKEKVTRVKFSFAFGFDDKMFSREWLNIPAGVTPKFLILSPPAKLDYFDPGAKKWRKKDIPQEYSKKMDTANASISDPFWRGIPAIELDSWINPGDATVVPVYPADNATAKLFQATAATDHGGLLSNLRLELVRWVKPEFIRIIRDFYEPTGAEKNAGAKAR
jgi:hypothetical protein